MLHFFSSSAADLWSSRGCEVTFSNDTHTACQCYHLTNFAILTDMFDVMVSCQHLHACTQQTSTVAVRCAKQQKWFCHLAVSVAG